MTARPTAKARLAAALTGMALASLVISTSGGLAHADSKDRKLARTAAEVRRATAKYHNVENALADGYIPLGGLHCVEYPGVGAMGFHYYNPDLLLDGVLDPIKPELLLYAPSGNGTRLVAVEYMMPVSLWSGSEAPDIFGVPFDGPMPEHEPGTSGVHYDQHFWIWSHNPAGILATWNPALTC